MPAKKQYADVSQYESKLSRVMERLGVIEYNYNYDRFGGWVEFRYKGELYRFDHSVENANAHGVNIHYGSDAFSQIVLALEDLARMVERGIYDLKIWIAGMKFLPQTVEIPNCFVRLGFTEIPGNVEEVKVRYKNLAKTLHPDNGGSSSEFNDLKNASEQAIKYVQTNK